MTAARRVDLNHIDTEPFDTFRVLSREEVAFNHRDFNLVDESRQCILQQSRLAGTRRAH